MAVRIEVYVDDELEGDVEFDSRAEAEEAGVGKAVLELIPFSEEEVDAMTPEEKEAYIQKLTEDLEES